MKRKTHIGLLFKSAILACLVLGYASCVDDDEVAALQNLAKSDVVTFNISTTNRWTPDVIGGSRSASSEERKSNSKRTEALPMESDTNVPGEQIYMYMIEEDCPTVVDTATVTSRNAVQKEALYGIIAYQGEGDNNIPTSVFMNNLALYDDGSYDGGYKYFPGSSKWLHFFAYSPYSLDNTGIEVPSYTENQTLTEFSPIYTFQISPNVANHRDFMLGQSEKRNGSNTSKVEIELQHLLSKIQVKQGNIACGEVKSVSFTGIKSKGTYTFIQNSEGNWVGGWNIDTDIENYTQPYIEQIETTDEGSTQTPTLTIDETTKIVGQPFYLLPQELSDDAMIEINMEVTSTDTKSASDSELIQRVGKYPISKKLKEFVNNWEPNKQYTFVISTPQEVQIEVSDEVVLEGGYPVKKNLKITNTGLAPAYVRVCMVGSWVIDKDGEQLIVADWKETDGTFEWGATEPTMGVNNENNWRKGSDGLYYYMSQLKRDEKAKPLFEKYTLTAEPPMVGAYLDLTIAVQAVLVEDLSVAWNESTLIDPIWK